MTVLIVAWGLMMTRRLCKKTAIAAHSLGMSHESMARVYQVHSADIVTITAPEQLSEHPKADGLVTRLSGITLSILTADCTPVLFYDAQSLIIGACHAGWRGAALDYSKYS